MYDGEVKFDIELGKTLQKDGTRQSMLAMTYDSAARRRCSACRLPARATVRRARRSPPRSTSRKSRGRASHDHRQGHDRHARLPGDARAEHPERSRPASLALGQRVAKLLHHPGRDVELEAAANLEQEVLPQRRLHTLLEAHPGAVIAEQTDEPSRRAWNLLRFARAVHTCTVVPCREVPRP